MTGGRPHVTAPTRPRPTLHRERRLWRAGHRWVAGLDEVGRGAWAGPVSVGIAVVATDARPASVPPRLRDSKLLTELQREAVFEEVAHWCVDGAVGHATATECDRWGMSIALRLAARRALGALELWPTAVVVDGPVDLLRSPGPPPMPEPGPPPMPEPGPPPMPEPGPPPSGLSILPQATAWPPAGRAPSFASAGAGSGAAPPAGPGAAAPAVDVAGAASAVMVAGAAPAVDVAGAAPAVLAGAAPGRLPDVVEPVVGADASCAAVAAASVLAKVVRDRLMREEAEHFPPYGFDRNKGYPSPRHQAALRGYGLSAIHRRSWSYVAGLPWRTVGLTIADAPTWGTAT